MAEIHQNQHVNFPVANRSETSNLEAYTLMKPASRLNYSWVQIETSGVSMLNPAQDFSQAAANFNNAAQVLRLDQAGNVLRNLQRVRPPLDRTNMPLIEIVEAL
jgi:hypothetical protein